MHLCRRKEATWEATGRKWLCTHLWYDCDTARSCQLTAEGAKLTQLENEAKRKEAGGWSEKREQLIVQDEKSQENNPSKSALSDSKNIQRPAESSTPHKLDINHATRNNLKIFPASVPSWHNVLLRHVPSKVRMNFCMWMESGAKNTQRSVHFSNNEKMMRWGTMLALCSVFVVTNLYAREPWVTLTDCRYLANDANDGDSFHVRSGSKSYLFRLYFSMHQKPPWTSASV